MGQRFPVSRSILGTIEFRVWDRGLGFRLWESIRFRTKDLKDLWTGETKTSGNGHASTDVYSML